MRLPWEISADICARVCSLQKSTPHTRTAKNQSFFRAGFLRPFLKDNKSKPYAAASSITGKQVYLGSFATRTEAMQALKDYEYNPITAFNITLDQLRDEWLCKTT